MICNESGVCGEAGCEESDHFKYYGPPECQRIMKNLNQASFIDKEVYIQAYLVSLNAECQRWSHQIFIINYHYQNGSNYRACVV